MILIGVGCSPSITNINTSSGYEEDLSQYRPVYELPKTASTGGEESAPPLANTDTLRSSLEITQQVTYLLDSLQIQNQKIKFIQGFTVQVYSGSNRDAASRARTEVYKLVTGVDTQIRYVQPNFKVKVGQFTDRLEAQKVYSRLKPSFPLAIIVPEKIRIE